MRSVGNFSTINPRRIKCFTFNLINIIYISLFLLILAIVYIVYLHGKNEELKELQKTIALLQEQILLLDGIKKRISKAI